MAYDTFTVYAKYLKKKITHGGCSEGCEEECSCCPPGLVSVPDQNGKMSGCLTPNDAKIYAESLPCAAGYVKLYKEGETAQFLGCVPADEFAALYAAVNPS